MATNTYEFDAKRWCMSMSKIHHARSDFDTASTFRSVAEEIDNLRNAVSKLQAEAEILRGRGHELEALRESVRPIAEWYTEIRNHAVWDGKKVNPEMTVLGGCTVAQYDALAALAGEEGLPDEEKQKTRVGGGCVRF